MTASRREPLLAITGVRFLLAFWVIALHMTSANEPFRWLILRSPLLLQEIIAAGASAVGVFFLLSGFVLAYNYDLTDEWAPARRKRFWMARAARIYPVYLFALVLAIPSLIAGLLKTPPLHPLALAAGSGEVLLLLQAWVPQNALFWGGPAWSLSAEAFFYLCFPFIGRALWKAERKSLQLALLAGLWLTVCAAAWALAAWKVPDLLHPGFAQDTTWSEVIKFDPLIRLPEFLAGVVLCKIFVSRRRSGAAAVRSGYGPLLYLSGMAVALLIFSQEAHLPPAVLHDGLLLPATAAIIFGLSVGGGWVARWLARPWIVLLGQASYGMYLLHMPLYSYFASADKRFVHTPAAAWVSFLLYLGSLVALCCVTFFRLEEPSRRAILRWFYPDKPEPRLEPQSVAADPF